MDRLAGRCQKTQRKPGDQLLSVALDRCRSCSCIKPESNTGANTMGDVSHPGSTEDNGEEKHQEEAGKTKSVITS